MNALSLRNKVWIALCWGVLLFPRPSLAEEGPLLLAQAHTEALAGSDSVDTGEDELSDEDRPSAWGASLGIETSVGLGTFAPAPQDNALVVTSLSPNVSYDLPDAMRLSLGFALTWYQVNPVDLPLANHSFLLSDIAIGLSHGRIYRHEDSGFSVTGNVRLALPTSLASQYQNRLFTLGLGAGASIPVGPVTFSYALGLGKYFNSTATPTVNCDDFDDPTLCLEGRDANPNFGFESERRGAEVYVPGMGVNSFYVSNALRVHWAIWDALSLRLGVSVWNTFGARSFAHDEFSSANAKAGRSQRDRLISDLTLAYTVNRHLGLALSLVTDTSQPFGAQGDDFPVIFDFKRLSDNITSLNLSVTGSL